MAVANDWSDVAVSKSYSAAGGMINITLSLPPMKHFNVSIVAYNAFGKANLDAFISELLFMAQIRIDVFNLLLVYSQNHWSYYM